ncbi:rhodanese domain-containing protein CG4456-like [Musca autumnalis]|uniref:rhodanese domain-containing protein CG4456-like n=1 Tax=Musca autumnalis TaxID=221902 RepID=UPI003CE6DE32
MSRRALVLARHHIKTLSFGGSINNLTTKLLATHTSSSLDNGKFNQQKVFLKHFCSQTSINNIPIAKFEEIKQLKEYPNKMLIDVREPQELQESGKIPTSINIPLDQVITVLSHDTDASAFKTKYGRDLPELKTELIFHCRSGIRSQKAAEIAKQLGYVNVKNYVGSWLEWAEKNGLPK